jgi:hypothetical protein
MPARAENKRKLLLPDEIKQPEGSVELVFLWRKILSDNLPSIAVNS